MDFGVSVVAPLWHSSVHFFLFFRDDVEGDN